MRPVNFRGDYSGDCLVMNMISIMGLGVAFRMQRRHKTCANGRIGIAVGRCAFDGGGKWGQIRYLAFMRGDATPWRWR